MPICSQTLINLSCRIPYSLIDWSLSHICILRRIKTRGNGRHAGHQDMSHIVLTIHSLERQSSPSSVHRSHLWV